MATGAPRRAAAAAAAAAASTAASSGTDEHWPAVMAVAQKTLAEDGGSFYEQIHSEIKDLRQRVDGRLKAVVTRNECDLDLLTEQLTALKKLDFDGSERTSSTYALDEMRNNDKSFRDLRISSSAATEPATNTRQTSVVRRLHKINFPDDETAADSDDETEASSMSGYNFRNSVIKDRTRPHHAVATSDSDAVTQARESRELASPNCRRSTHTQSNERHEAMSDSNAIVPIEFTRSPYADQVREQVKASLGKQFRNAIARTSSEVRNGFSTSRKHPKQVPSLLDEANNPRPREIDPLYPATAPDPSGRRRPVTSKRKSQRDRASQLDELMSSLDYLDQPSANDDAAAAAAAAKETRLVVVDNSDAYSLARSTAHSVASQSIVYKARNLESLAHRSVTDSMALHSSNDMIANIAAGKSKGVVRIEKVQGRALTDPYGDRGRYTGILVKGKPYGHGTMHYDDGRSYTGDWKNGRWQGKGRTLFVNGDFYVGEYLKDQRHGLGRYEWSDGRVYDGQFFKDRREGKGTYTWPDGAIYAGDFKAGHRHGQGCYKFPDGSVYTGEFKDGKYHGVGECVWADGRWYRGEWLDGHAHGYGVEVRPDGTIRHDGEWKCDRPVRDGKELADSTEKEAQKRKTVIPEGERPQRKISHPLSPRTES